MYLSILFYNVYNNLHCSMVRMFCLYLAASPDNDTRLQTTNINKAFDLHIKFVYEVIALYQLHKKWQLNVVAF